MTRIRPTRAQSETAATFMALSSAEDGLPVPEEGGHALPEVLARVGLDDEVVALHAPPRRLEPPDRLLGDTQRDGRVRGDLRGDLAHARLQVAGGHDLADEPGLPRLLRAHQPGAVEEVLRTSRAEEGDHPSAVGHGAAVAETARDRDADLALRRAV